MNWRTVERIQIVGQDEEWSEAQKRLIASLAAQAEFQVEGTVDERKEVADAMLRGLYKLSLRQGVMRLLRSLASTTSRKSGTTFTGNAALWCTAWRRGLVPTMDRWHSGR